MALTFNGTAPTEIIVINDSSFYITWPRGTKSTTWSSTGTGSWYCFGSFSSTSTYGYTKIVCNNIVLTSSEKLIYSTSEVDGTETTAYNMYASYNGGTLTLRQSVGITTTTQPTSTTTNVVGINYEGTFSGQTSLTVLNQNGTNVWGKLYSLSISQGANTSVTVSRTNSPNQHASTGTLLSGSVVYYGDVLTITASASSGYALSAFTVNGTAWTSGNSITVSSAITVTTVAQSAASWHTKFTGDHSVVAILKNTAPTVSVNVNGEDIGEVVVLDNGHTRISGNVLAYDADGIQTTENFTNITIWSEEDARLLRTAYDTTASYYANCYVYTDSSGEITEAFNFQLNRVSGLFIHFIISASLHITKVEQYY